MIEGIADTINITSRGGLNLSGDRFSVDSTNLNITNDGSVTCSDISITGGDVNIESTSYTNGTISTYFKTHPDVKTEIAPLGINVTGSDYTYTSYSTAQYLSTGIGAFTYPDGGIVSILEWDGNINNKNLNIDTINHKSIVDLIYPVGSIYMSVKNTNPATLFGGTWVAWGSGRVPVGVNASDSNFNTVEKTGGTKTHTLTADQIPSHQHSIPALSGSATGGAHTHEVREANNTAIGAYSNAKWTAGGGGFGRTGDAPVNRLIAASSTHSHTVTTNASWTGATGRGGAHNNLQPYITCYMWKRTA